MDGVSGSNEEQFQMLLMVLEDVKHGICLFQSEEQSEWVALIQREAGSRRVAAHNIAEDNEKAGMPVISDFKRWSGESDANIVIVYNLQLLGMRFGDQAAVEHLNFMRDQIQHIGKLFLFGVSPYFAMLLSRSARDLYSCIRYHFKFCSFKMEPDRMGPESYREPGGDYALELEKYWEYKKRLQGQTGEGKIQLCLECMNSWQRVRGNLPFQERNDIRQMAELLEQYYREKKLDLSDVEQIWILADTWLELEEVEKGFYWYKLTVDEIEAKLGKTHKLYADGLVRLTEYYQRISDYEQCEKNYDYALRIYEDKKMPMEGSYQDALMRRAILCRRKSQFGQALAIYEKVLDYNTKKYGSGYYDNAVCLNNMGRVYMGLNDASKALSYFQEALNLLLASGEKNDLLPVLYNNISYVYLINGDMKTAWKHIKQAKREAENLYGQESVCLIGIYNLMADIWNERGRFDKAVEYLQKAMELIKKTHTEETENAAFVYYNMGNALAKEKKPLQALDFLHRALELRLKIYGEWNGLTANTYEALGFTFNQLSNFKESRENLDKARKIYAAI